MTAPPASSLEATELEWLEWFYQNCDFGPAHGDVMLSMQELFAIDTGKKVPEAYVYE